MFNSPLKTSPSSDTKLERGTSNDVVEITNFSEGDVVLDDSPINPAAE